jgi:signal transduction histidine kinase
MTRASRWPYRAGVDRPPPWRHQPGHGPHRAWVAAAAVSIVQLVGTSFAAADQPGRRALDLVGLALLALSGLLLVARRPYPLPTLVAVATTTAAYYGLGYPYGPAFLALLLATVHVVVRGRRTAGWLGVLLAVGGALATARLRTGSWPTLGETALAVAAGVALVGIAELVRSRAERFAEARRAHVETGRRRASEDRLRLARDLHDVLAHDVSLIHVQASTALHLFDADPERARTALAAIKEVSHGTLEELRGTVRALRAEGEDAPRSPTAGLAGLDELAAQTAAVGPQVEVSRTGTPAALPSRIDLAAFRIVQEALTNVRRHAAAQHVQVRLHYGPEELVVTVVDDGAGSTGTAEGHGLQGMRERAQALGGTLTTEAAAGGGFAVTARLPRPAARGRTLRQGSGPR